MATRYFLSISGVRQQGQFSSTVSALACIAPFHELALQFESGLAQVFLDKAQTLFGMLPNPLQTFLEIRSPMFDVREQQVGLEPGGDFIGRLWPRSS